MYTEETSFYIDYKFDIELSKLSEDLENEIIRQIGKSIKTLPKRNYTTQYIGGVSLIGEPVYFMIEYINEYNREAVLMKLTITDSDTYLDLINISKTIKNDSKNIKRRRRNTVKVDNKK
jgi:hypothetical protein